MRGQITVQFNRVVQSALACFIISISLQLAGCANHQEAARCDPPAPKMLGSTLDTINMRQETNAEASKFVIYAHEFELNDPSDKNLETGWRLNEYGQDHVKQIAANIRTGVCGFPVVVERSETSTKPSRYEYPIHFNEALDAKRRQAIVSSLHAFGIVDAENRVVVAPAFAEGYTASEASRAYNRGLSNGGNGGSGFGRSGGFGGGLGSGGFGF